MSYSTLDLMQLAVSENAAGIHVWPGEPPVLELRDTLEAIQGPAVEPGETLEMLQEIFPTEKIKEMTRESLSVEYFRFSEARVFKVMVFGRKGGHRLELRQVTQLENAA